MDPLPKEIGARTRVLIKCHADGLIEVFGNRGELSIQIVDVPDVSEVEFEETESLIKAELMAESYVDRQVRWGHRDINYPSNRVVGHYPVCSLAARYWRKIDLVMLKAVR